MWSIASTRCRYTRVEFAPPNSQMVRVACSGKSLCFRMRMGNRYPSPFTSTDRLSFLMTLFIECGHPNWLKSRWSTTQSLKFITSFSKSFSWSKAKSSNVVCPIITCVCALFALIGSAGKLNSTIILSPKSSRTVTIRKALNRTCVGVSLASQAIKRLWWV